MNIRLVLLAAGSALVLMLTNGFAARFVEDFDGTNNRVWIGKHTWAVPMEGWSVNNHRLESTGANPEQRVNFLEYWLNGKGSVSLSVDAGLRARGKAEGTAGFRLGMQDETDNSYKSLCYFGRGVNVGIHTGGYVFIDSVQEELPLNFLWQKFTLRVTAISTDNSSEISVRVIDSAGVGTELRMRRPSTLRGMTALLNNHFPVRDYPGGPSFWFDNVALEGSMVEHVPQNAFGPILWAMYTVSRDKLRMTAQMPPISLQDEQVVTLQIRRNGKWATVGSASIDSASYTAVFSVDKWDRSQSHNYRLVYNEAEGGKILPRYYEGIISRDPVDHPLRIGALTCQEHNGFPYRPLVEQLGRAKPDLLYFSGDQIYEANGGYPIVRFPADKAILNYLGKWYMFGWAFGEVMRNCPTICIPDDHDVYQGNLWGSGGKKVDIETWRAATDCVSGFVEPAEMVSVVMRTQCSHLPAPYDPTPMEQGIPVYYTDLVYGRVSFAVCGDRVFKSGPEQVAWWSGRKDQIKEKIDPRRLEKPGLQFLGTRQEQFLEHWVTDWNGADMKVLLTQTIFANATTHHSRLKTFLYGDMDSGGWPKTGRDRVLRIVRKALAFHICGDQHLTVLGQYGIDTQRDAGWFICTPAISVGYERRFLPDSLGVPVVNRPQHNVPNTGEYEDVFGNLFFVYAIGNPVDKTSHINRYRQSQNRGSGFSLVTMDQKVRSINVESLAFLPDSRQPDGKNYYPGFPHQLKQMDNDGREAKAFLPDIVVTGLANPVVQVVNEQTNEVEYCVRISGSTFRPKVFLNGTYTIKVGEPETSRWKTVSNISPLSEKEKQELVMAF